MLGDIAGTAPLREALETTNDLLAQVLEELKRVNADGLVTIADELRAINDALPAADRAA
ncbi:hypothetical protein GCM10023200_25820 [Actinomycetospora chlora]|jgi:hypothetical protein|uniref:Uncharacterized protein n=1 Tax=Actinomycetospora chlora TaxID=663608 RepID=A0ABP9B6X7_9PSEU